MAKRAGSTGAGQHVLSLTGPRSHVLVEEPGVGSQLRKLARTRTFDFASVSQLRSAQWFATEQTLPYGGWPRALAKVARTAHHAAQGQLAECTDAASAEQVLADFVRVFNGRNDIETTEREDIATAVAQLVAPAQIAALVSQDRAQQIFESERDY